MGSNNSVACKTLLVKQRLKNGFLGEPQRTKFYINKKQVQIAVNVNQIGIRTREIHFISENLIKPDDLFNIYRTLEKLIMIFEGRFIPITEVSLSDSASSVDGELKNLSNEFMESRLSYYSSADFMQDYDNKFIDFSDVLSTELFCKWEELVCELDIAHQIVLYSLSDIRLPVDIKCAFLIESAETLVQLVAARKNFFSSLKPGKHGTTLRMCLDVLITKYGEDIFDVELKNDYDKFLSALVNSRNRIMHIKTKQETPYFSDKEYVLYSIKMSCLYRKVLLELLEIDYLVYKAKLCEYICNYEDWRNHC